MYDIVVVGGGFRGLVVSHLALKRGFKVALLERSNSLGGFLDSYEWKGFTVDRGVQLFDSVPLKLQDIVVDELGIDVEPIDFTYGSVYDGRVTPGFALPNYSSINQRDKEKILFELAQRIGSSKSGDCNFMDFLVDRYGPTATEYMAASFKNIYRLNLCKADSSAISQTAFHRLCFLNDELAVNLKRHPDLDSKLAARRAAVGKVDDFVSFYPRSGGMKAVADGFETFINRSGGAICRNMDIASISHYGNEKHLAIKARNNDIQIIGKNIVWCSPLAELEKTLHQESTIADKEFATPMISFTFEVDASFVNNYTYLHQFSPSTFVYRSSAMGIYSGQVNTDGKTFITAECPTDVGSDLWNAPEAHVKDIWSELGQMDLLSSRDKKWSDFQCVKLPSTHRVPKFGHAVASKSYEERIKKKYPNLIVDGHQAFLRRDIFLNSNSIVDAL